MINVLSAVRAFMAERGWRPTVAPPEVGHTEEEASEFRAVACTFYGADPHCVPTCFSFPDVLPAQLLSELMSFHDVPADTPVNDQGSSHDQAPEQPPVEEAAPNGGQPDGEPLDSPPAAEADAVAEDEESFVVERKHAEDEESVVEGKHAEALEAAMVAEDVAAEIVQKAPAKSFDKKSRK